MDKISKTLAYISLFGFFLAYLPKPLLAQVPFHQVDPVSDTDNYINNYIKQEFLDGKKETVGAGVWWGPTDKFFENQLWVVNKDVKLGKVYQPGENMPSTFTCVMPGKLAGKGTAKNTITIPQLVYGFGSVTSKRSNKPLETYVTLSHKATNDRGGIELRTDCFAEEAVDNNFGDGTAIKGDEIKAIMGTVAYFEKKRSPGSFSNHARTDEIKYETLDVHAWYEKLGYVYIALDGARDANGDMSTQELIGGTVSGNLTVWGFANRTRLGENNQKSQVHHMELRVEQEGEDFTVGRKGSGHGGDPLLIRGERQSFTFDTREFRDGWHILSWHAHILDMQNSAPRRGKQLAGELKIPICIKNNTASDCDRPVEVTNPPTQPPSTPTDPPIQGFPDIDADGDIDFLDFNLLLVGFGPSYDIYDYNDMVREY